MRYRYPVLWMSYLLGAHALVELVALHGRLDGSSREGPEG